MPPINNSTQTNTQKEFKRLKADFAYYVLWKDRLNGITNGPPSSFKLPPAIIHPLTPREKATNKQIQPAVNENKINSQTARIHSSRTQNIVPQHRVSDILKVEKRRHISETSPLNPPRDAKHDGKKYHKK